MTAEPHPAPTPRPARSRRSAVRDGALLAALGTISLRLGVAAQATPEAAAGNALLVQSFGQGSLFPTQGDVGVLPFTAILWDAADRRFLLHDAAAGSVGLVATDAVLTALAAAEEAPLAALLAVAADESANAAPVWALRLVSGVLGADPGAVTYQGEPLPADAVWQGTALPDLPAAPRDLGAGYLVLIGLSGY